MFFLFFLNYTIIDSATITNGLLVDGETDLNDVLTTKDIIMDAGCYLNMSGVGIINQSGTGTNQLKDSTISSLTVSNLNSAVDINAPLTCQGIIQDSNFSISQSGSSTNTFNNSNIASLAVSGTTTLNNSTDINAPLSGNNSR